MRGTGIVAQFGDASDAVQIRFNAVNGDWDIGKFNTTNNNFDFFYAGNWRVGLNSTNGNYLQSSDGRLKKNIRKIDHALDKILQLQGSSFSWKDSGATDIGLIAQNVERVFPEVVSQNQNGYKGLSYAKLVAPLIEGVKELKTEKDTQVLALEKRAAEAEQKYAVMLRQAQHDKAQAEARAAKLERLLVEENQARKQQELRLVQLEDRFIKFASRRTNSGAGSAVARR